MRTFTYYLIADHQGNARLRQRKPRAGELSPLQYLFTLHVRVPEVERRETEVFIDLPALEVDGGGITAEVAQAPVDEEQP